jgi:DNA-binding transcriptional LysR family regulator
MFGGPFGEFSEIALGGEALPGSGNSKYAVPDRTEAKALCVSASEFDRRSIYENCQGDRLNIRQLEAFRAFMMSGSTTGAAQLLGVSQPAVSRLIDQLERKISFPLFDRKKGRLVPTPEAQLLFEEVERTFASVDKIRELAADIRAANTGRLNIAILPALSFRFLPAVIEQFRAEHPRTTISMTIQTSLKIEEWAAAQHIDFGIAEFPFIRAGVETEDFCRVPYVMALPKGHALERKKVLKPVDLAGESFISFTGNTTGRHLIDQAFHRAQVARRMVIETQYSAVVAELVCRRLGIGLIDPFTAYDFRDRDIVTRPFVPGLEFHLGILHPSHRSLSRAAKSFLNVLRAAKNTVLTIT